MEIDASGVNGSRKPEKRKIRVVVVDDSPFVLNWLSMFLLGDSRLEIVGMAADGAKAIQCVESLEPDLVVMDLEMPVLDGLKASKEIRSRFPHTRIVLTSEHDGASWQRLSRGSGADEFVPKHQLGRELISCVERLFADMQQAYE